MASPSEPSPGKQKSILIVCYGNICRSPLAEVLLKNQLAALGLQDRFKVSSAGVRALADHRAATGMREVADAHGVSMDSHRGRSLTREMGRSADVVIALDEVVEEEIWIRCGNDVKILLWPVDDPFGGTPGDFVKAYGVIQDLVNQYVARLQQEVRSL